MLFCYILIANDYNVQVETMRRKMEGISKEMLQRIEEDFGSILSITAASSEASSASTSKSIEYPVSAFPNQVGF